MNKNRDFWISHYDHFAHTIYPICLSAYSEENRHKIKDAGESEYSKSIHVREVDPARDALFEEMQLMLKRLTAYILQPDDENTVLGEAMDLVAKVEDLK